MADQQARSHPLRQLRRLLVSFLIVYFVAGNVSQKMIPGVDEIFPFFGWSLFSKVPGHESRYEVVIHRHNGRELAPAQAYLSAPPSMVAGDRYVGRKVLQQLGKALDEGESTKAERLRRLFERNYLRGPLEYELVFESYDPLIKWKTGESLEDRSLGRFQKGGRQP